MKSSSFHRIQRGREVGNQVAVAGAASICDPISDGHKRELAGNELQLSACEHLQDPLDGD